MMFVTTKRLERETRDADREMQRLRDDLWVQKHRIDLLLRHLDLQERTVHAHTELLRKYSPEPGDE